jgi:hypothetical protein
MIFQKKNISLLVTFLISVFVAVIFRNDCFMWDNIVIPSATASFFYYNGFHIFSMGNFLDCGHPPLLSVYLALAWKFFGRNLLVSHLSQIPFIWLLIHQLYLFIKKIFIASQLKIGIIITAVLLVADTTIISQLAQVGYEIPVIAFWLMAINLYWKKVSSKTDLTKSEFILYFLSIIILPFFQLRSIPLLIAFCFAQIVFHFSTQKFDLKKTLYVILPFFISAFIFCIWLIIHFNKVGYLISDPNSTWGAENVGIASFHQMIKNAGIIGIRFLDNSHWLNCAAMLYITYKFFERKKYKLESFSSFLFLIWLITSTVLSINFMVMSKPICHRYFLPSFILIPIIIARILRDVQSFKLKTFTIYILAFIMLSSNYVMFFSKYGIGWDSTLAHLPYNQLRKNAFDYLQKNKIESKACGTRFPFNVSDSLVFLHSSSAQLSTISQNSLADFEYVLQSNISTSFTPEQLDLLKRKYTVEKMWNKGLVEIRLYKKVH